MAKLQHDLRDERGAREALEREARKNHEEDRANAARVEGDLLRRLQLAAEERWKSDEAVRERAEWLAKFAQDRAARRRCCPRNTA